MGRFGGHLLLLVTLSEVLVAHCAHWVTPTAPRPAVGPVLRNPLLVKDLDPGALPPPQPLTVAEVAGHCRLRLAGSDPTGSDSLAVTRWQWLAGRSRFDMPSLLQHRKAQGSSGRCTSAHRLHTSSLGLPQRCLMSLGQRSVQARRTHCCQTSGSLPPKLHPRSTRHPPSSRQSSWTQRSPSRAREIRSIDLNLLRQQGRSRRYQRQPTDPSGPDPLFHECAPRRPPLHVAGSD